VSLVIASSAAAEPLSAEPIRVQYRAPESCPDAAWFEAQILARTQRVRLAAMGEPARTIDVAIEEGERTVGRLSIRGRDDAVTKREVAGDDCNEVASALALVTALVVDPDAVATPVVAAPRPETPSPAPTPGSAAPLPRLLPPRVEAPPPAPRLRFSVGESVSIAGGVSPGPLVGGLVFAAIEREGGAFSQTIRLSLSRSLSSPIDVSAGAAHLDWTIGVLDVRPWSFVLDGVVFAPTVELEAGALHGDGSGVALPQHPTRPWVSLGLGAGATWRFYGPLFLDLVASFQVPFYRDNFYFDPNPSRTVSRAAPVGSRGALGLGARFP
jgi:hypothetical protein